MLKDVNRPALEAFGRQLAEARTRKGLSQRALAQRVGMTQANVSKVERGQVDLRLSSLVELARALDLDVQLVPRQALAAVEGVRRALRSEDVGTSRAIPILIKQLAQLSQLHERYPELRAIQRLLDSLKDLRGRAFNRADLTLLEQMMLPIERMTSAAADDPDEITRIADQTNRRLSRLETMRDHLSGSDADTGRPAFRLDEDDDD